MWSKKKLDDIVKNDEPLARYIFSTAHFSTGRIKRQAFMPPFGKSYVSVMRHKNCPKDCLLKIGKQIEKNRSLKAVGSILTDDVRAINNLDVESDISDGQHRRHANIKNFNNYTDAKLREVAQQLTKKADLLFKL